MVDRVEHVEQFHRFVAETQLSERDDRPQGGVRVLAAVLADTGHVALDVTGILRHAVEGRREQQHDLRVASHQVGPHRLHRARGAARVGILAKTAHDCVSESMRHSSFCADPSGVPSSKYARRYQLPSQASSSMPVSQRASLR